MTEAERVKAEYQKTLNRQGFPFQYRIVHEITSLGYADKIEWVFEVSEFPVEVRGRSTRIDSIYRHEDTDAILVAECKRANPAFCHWCFAPSRYARRVGADTTIVAQTVTMDLNQSASVAGFGYAFTSAEGIPQTGPYHVVVEVRSGAKGDEKGSKPDNIEDAASQVCRGVSGLIDFLSVRRTNLIRASQTVPVIPVIFTTARLWYTDANLQTTNLTTGEISLADFGFTEVDWLFFQYSQSPGVTYEGPTYVLPDSPTLEDIHRAEFTRTIAVVSPSGVESFLRQAGMIDFKMPEIAPIRV